MKILCIGRNYVDHIKELENEVSGDPVVFLKPETALLRNGNPFYIPDFADEFHYEVELLVKINKLGKNIEPEFAHRYYDEIGIGIDFTARDLQNKLRNKGLPWEKCKAFDSSAAVSEFVPKSVYPDINNINFHLDVNGETRQKGNSSMMIYKIDTIVSHLSKYFTLKIGDIIFTGTPAGVGPVKIDDRLQLFIEDELMLDFMIK
ncbi:MAG: fumarylacetoacetate hydrolase family protein [Chlorobi bacterium]|nr:fumarylacetoacetate hydrolase family protein [Chlorobiota bacterium]